MSAALFSDDGAFRVRFKYCKIIAAGFFKKLVQPGDEVVRGDIIANIINPMTGENTTDIYAPTDGIIFYCQNSPMIYQNSVIFKMIRRLHN